MFGEVYPDPVRIVSVGKSVTELLADPKNASLTDYSIEFCGGTYVSAFNSPARKRFFTNLTGTCCAAAILAPLQSFQKNPSQRASAALLV